LLAQSYASMHLDIPAAKKIAATIIGA